MTYRRCPRAGHLWRHVPERLAGSGTGHNVSRNELIFLPPGTTAAVWRGFVGPPLFPSCRIRWPCLRRAMTKMSWFRRAGPWQDR